MRTIVSVPEGKKVKFNGNTCKVLAIMDALRRAQKPVKVEEILEMTVDDGVMMTGKDESVEASGILGKLKNVGAVHNPVGIQAPTRHYWLSKRVKVVVTFD